MDKAIIYIEDRSHNNDNVFNSLRDKYNVSYRLYKKPNLDEGLQTLKKCLNQDVEVPVIIFNCDMLKLIKQNVLKTISTKSPATKNIIITDKSYMNYMLKYFNSRLIFKCVYRPFEQGKLITCIHDAMEEYNKNASLELDSLRYKILYKKYKLLYNIMEKNFDDTIDALSHAVDARDNLTAGHSKRVAEYAVYLGKKLNFPRGKLKELKYMGILHDIGKIGIRDNVLLKKEIFTDEDYLDIKRHTSIGAEIVSSISGFRGLVPGIKYHHERYDGSGYHGLKGKKIPLQARILAIADVYDALTSKRVYKNPLTSEEATAIMRGERGSHFDPELLDLFFS